MESGDKRQEDLAEWLLFAAVELRPRLARRLLDHMGGPAAVLQADRRELLAVEGVTAEMADRIQTGRQHKDLAGWLNFSSRYGVHAVPFDSPCYPRLLNEIPDPPVVLFVRGCPEVLAADAVAMVGTRMATRYGKLTAETIARALAASGITVASGGAIGIDTAVHRGAAGAGSTIAVLGCGLDVRYPASNQELFEKIVERGALVSEFSLGARPDNWRFPARNRIISGMSRATVVVEAAEKSGALITAEFAMEQGREVMAVPGPVNSPQSRGCHGLIRDGAGLVENAEQVLQSLGWAGVPEYGRDVSRPAVPVDLPLDQGVMLQALSGGQKHLDDLSSECGLSPSQAGAAVTLLEMRGLVRRIPGNHYVRV